MSLFRDLLIEKKRKPYYCEVEYLESTGTQYIDTGFKIDDTCGYDISWMALNANDTIIMGTKGTGDSRWVLSGNNNPNVNLSWNTSSGSTGLGLNKIQTAQMNYLNDRERVLNGVALTDISTTLSADASTYNVCIFGGYWGSSTVSLYSTCRIYYVKITKGLTLVRDLLPVLDWNYTPCMYDKVSGKLFYNAGTGSFTYGREIHYVDYLESTETQYIDLGLYGNLNTEIEVKAYVPEHTTHFALVGDFTDSTKAITLPVNYGTSGLYSRFGNKSITTGLGTNEGTYKFVINKTGYYRDDVLLGSFSTTTSFTTSSTLMLFGFTNLGRNYYAGKVYYCKVYDNGAIVGDFLPAIDENGVGFMFDRVTHTIHDNIGIGYFKYPAREVSYLETTGGSYLNTDFNPGANGGRFTFDVEIKCTPNSNGHGAIGSRSVDAGRNWVITNIPQTPNNQVVQQFGYGNTWQNVTADSSNKWIRCRTYIDGENYVFETMVDGLTSIEVTPLQTFTNSANVYLLNINNKGSVFSNFNFIGQMRRAKLYDNGTLVKDYKPAFKNGYFGLWDAVNDYLPTINGTGTITYGKIIESRWF